MLAPIRRRDLVFDQRVDGLGIRDAQQRLGQAHQRHALIGREAIFRQEHFHEARARLPPYVAHQLRAAFRDAGTIFGRQVGLSHQARERLGLICICGVVDLAADIGIVWHHAPLFGELGYLTTVS